MEVGRWGPTRLNMLGYCVTVLPILFMKTSALTDDVKEACGSRIWFCFCLGFFFFASCFLDECGSIFLLC